MPSPFPGMDPYLEAHWRDVHARLVIYASDALQGVLPRGLRACVQESAVVQTLQGFGDYPRRPDVRGVECTLKRGWDTRPESGVAEAGPILLDVGPEPVTEPFLEIIDREIGNRVVTVLEFLSPSKK